MSHAFLSVVIPFDAGRTEAVEARLDAMGNPPTGAIRDRLDEAAFVHFIGTYRYHAGAYLDATRKAIAEL